MEIDGTLRRENPICRSGGLKTLGVETFDVEAILRRLATPRPGNLTRRRAARAQCDGRFGVVMSGRANRFGHIGNEGQRIVVSTNRRHFAAQHTAGWSGREWESAEQGTGTSNSIDSRGQDLHRNELVSGCTVTNRQMWGMVNARFQAQFARRIVCMLRILYRPPLCVQFPTEQQKNYSYQWARDVLAMMDAVEASGSL
jgi:hypothetical protein